MVMALDFFKREGFPGPEFGGRPLAILHVSDLHFQDPRFGLARSRVVRRFLRALSRHMEGWRSRYPGTPNLDALFITGDVTYQCRDEDFEEARELIGEILELTGIPGIRVYVVPGEHDIYLRFIQNTDDTLQFPDEASWNQFLKEEHKGRSQRIAGRFQAYFRFLQSLGVEFGAKIPSASSDFFYADLFEHESQKVAVIGLNSAWSCRCRLEADRGMLCLGSYQVEEAFKRARKLNQDQHPDLVLSLVHHPAEWMKPEDKNALSRLAHHSHLVFRGHGHKGEQFLAAGPLQVPVISASSLCQEDPLPAFSVVAIDTATGKAYVWPYLWEPKESAFLLPPEHEVKFDQPFLSLDLPRQTTKTNP